jgi:hypothetical protein
VRILVDESLPRKLVRHLVSFECATVQQQGWSGLENGALLRRAAEAGFSVFLTADQNIEFQQNLEGSGIGVVVLAAPSNRMEHLEPLVPAAIEAIERVGEGEVLRVAR